MGDERDSVCSICGVVNSRKKIIKCDTCGCLFHLSYVKCDACGCLFHLSYVGLTRAQIEAFGRWNCDQCLGVARFPARAETTPINLVGYIGMCHHSLRVLNRIPKEDVIPVAEALQLLSREALDIGVPSELACGRLGVVIGIWSARVSAVGGGNSRFQRWLCSRLPDLWKTLISRPYKSPRERGMGSVKRMKLWREKLRPNLPRVMWMGIWGTSISWGFSTSGWRYTYGLEGKAPFGLRKP